MFINSGWIGRYVEDVFLVYYENNTPSYHPPFQIEFLGFVYQSANWINLALSIFLRQIRICSSEVVHSADNLLPTLYGDD